MYKLLICEDESLERKALNLIIQRHYLNIHLVGYATTGFEAIKLAHQHLPDIILMDIDMPQCNGLDAQKEICRFLPNVNTVIITAYNDFTYAQQAIKCGVNDFLLKPIAPNDLYNCLDKILGSMKKKDTSPTVPSEYTDYIQKILNYIDYHFLDDLNLSDLASEFNLNEKYLSRYFKQKTGTSFTEYIIKLKIERSKNMLKYSDAPIYEIAADLNFNDASYFTKVFQKQEGISPSQYRKNAGNSRPSIL
ncbi:response regulator transcription factor [Lacrimispora sp.]|uniref:response regulator transcription factor n=1 Tax=Lacrimispora sp. TaxID=2719234 RepID=UPI00289653A9|nr:response regulator [Lacrimispora sp.]